MAKRTISAAELIRNLIDGNNPVSAKRRLVTMGAGAIRPILEAMVGDHGGVGDSLDELVDVLVKIAKKDARPLLAALKGHPALNIVVWALGHGVVKRGRVDRQVHAALSRHRRHKDPGIRSVCEHHLSKLEDRRTKPKLPKRPPKKKLVRPKRPKRPPRPPRGPKKTTTKKKPAIKKGVVKKPKKTSKRVTTRKRAR